MRFRTLDGELTLWLLDSVRRPLDALEFRAIADGLTYLQALLAVAALLAALAKEQQVGFNRFRSLNDHRFIVGASKS